MYVFKLEEVSENCETMIFDFAVKHNTIEFYYKTT